MSMRSVYRKIAKKHGVSIAEVKREIQAAINHAYQNPNLSESVKAKQTSFSYKGEIPTPEEFIRYVAAEVREK